MSRLGSMTLRKSTLSTTRGFLELFLELNSWWSKSSPVASKTLPSR